MDPLEYLRLGLEQIKSDIYSSPFEEDDMRREFFHLQFDVLNNYYSGCSFLALANHLPTGNVLFSKGEIERIDLHIQRLTEIGIHPTLNASFRNNINRSVVVDSWSVFEFCLTIIGDYVLSETEKNELLAEQYLVINDILKNITIPDKENEKLKKILSKRHLTHVSVNRKCDKLFTKTKFYPRDVSADKQFLLFYGRYRNCLHSNYIYYGNDTEFEFKGIRFLFHNGQPVTHGQFDIKYHFDLAIEMMEIFKSIMLTIDYESKIPYPIEDAP